MNIKPIETVYKGYRFRSRAEARWAVFFDAAGIAYQYEPEGYVLSDGTKYLPDFYLPDMDMFFEVKGVMTDKDLHKTEQLMADSKKAVVIGYPDMTFQAANNWKDCEDEDDPAPTRADKNTSVLIECAECGKLFFMGWAGIYTCPCCGAYDGDHHLISNPSRVLSALERAKQARFEHGETPLCSTN